MTLVASRELRNDTAGIVRRARDGEEIVITVNGEPVAQLIAVQSRARSWLDRAEVIRRLTVAQADPAMRDDLASLGDNTTDEAGPIR
jgi:prevent-host-death family protein